MSVEAFCIVPKKIMEDFTNRSLLNNENPEVNENSILLDKKQKPFSEKKLPDLSIEISNLFLSGVKVKKAQEIYSWVLNNASEVIEISATGEILRPIKDINILVFLKDILSATKHFPKEKLEKYRIFSALINIPKLYLQNQKILNFIYPHEEPVIKPKIKMKVLKQKKNLNQKKT